MLHPVPFSNFLNINFVTGVAKNAAQSNPKTPSTIPLDEAYKILNVTKDIPPQELQTVHTSRYGFDYFLYRSLKQCLRQMTGRPEGPFICNLK